MCPLPCSDWHKAVTQVLRSFIPTRSSRISSGILSGTCNPTRQSNWWRAAPTIHVPTVSFFFVAFRVVFCCRLVILYYPIFLIGQSLILIHQFSMAFVSRKYLPRLSKSVRRGYCDSEETYFCGSERQRHGPNLVVVESVDSLKLADKLNAAAAATRQEPLAVYVQVPGFGCNTSASVAMHTNKTFGMPCPKESIALISHPIERCRRLFFWLAPTTPQFWFPGGGSLVSGHYQRAHDPRMQILFPFGWYSQNSWGFFLYLGVCMCIWSERANLSD